MGAEYTLAEIIAAGPALQRAGYRSITFHTNGDVSYDLAYSPSRQLDTEPAPPPPPGSMRTVYAPRTEMMPPPLDIDHEPEETDEERVARERELVDAVGGYDVACAPAPGSSGVHLAAEDDPESSREWTADMVFGG